MDLEINRFRIDNGVTVFTSLDGHFAVSDALTQLLKSTRESLLISSPWIGKGFVDLARKAIPSGISIKILTRIPKENDYSRDAVSSLSEVAKSDGWKIEIKCTSRHHPKFIIVDNEACLAGSLNPTEAGIYYNLELGFLMDAREVVKRLTDFFFKMWEASVSWHQVAQFHGFEATDRQSVHRRIAEKIISIFMGNGNTPLAKWKICSELKALGFEENEIINIEGHLLDRGVLYEPKLDWICLARSED
jgi:phosphatidylserine/phosphatidylglycerophosphate/cardiolipin synthase-like enzyme